MNPLSALLKAILQGMSFCRVLNPQVQLLCSHVRVYCSLLKTCHLPSDQPAAASPPFPSVNTAAGSLLLPWPPPKSCLCCHSGSSTIPSCKPLLPASTL